LIVPGQVAREEALSMHYDYWGEEVEKAAKNTVRVKDEVNRPGSRSRAGHVFASWNERFRDAWHLLPEPSFRSQPASETKGNPPLSARVVPNIQDRSAPKSPGETRVSVTQESRFGATNGVSPMTPQEIVRSLEYLQKAGMSETQLCTMHHFDRYQSYKSLIDYFEPKSEIRSDTNRDFGERLAYVVREHMAGHQEFAPLISKALKKWPLPG